jgi:hypothetical protein
MDEQATLVVGLCGVHAERLRIPLNGSIPTSLLLAVVMNVQLAGTHIRSYAESSVGVMQ